MSIKPAGVPVSLTYTAADAVALDFVAARIVDVTGGALGAEQVVAMPHWANGTHVGWFTPAVGRQYVVNKGVYTDGTYTTLDPTRAVTDQEVEGDTPVAGIAQGIIVQATGLLAGPITGYVADDTGPIQGFAEPC